MILKKQYNYLELFTIWDTKLPLNYLFFKVYAFKMQRYYIRNLL